jgi:hypothetical protein
MAILVLLMFFSMPVLNMAPEFLSQTTQDWFYSWTPLRFVAVGLREVMYFGGLVGFLLVWRLWYDKVNEMKEAGDDRWNGRQR